MALQGYKVERISFSDTVRSFLRKWHYSDYVKSFTLATEFESGSTNIDLSQYVYNQLNKVSGSYVYMFLTSPQVAGGAALYGTGSVPTVYIQEVFGQLVLVTFLVKMVN